jgi:predicted CopG family antitoxin
MNKFNQLPNNSNSKLTTISISKENYEKLKRLGCTAESFNDVLSRLLEKETGQNTRL